MFSGGSLAVASSVYEAACEDEKYHYTFVVSSNVFDVLPKRKSSVSIYVLDAVGLKSVLNLYRFKQIEKEADPDLVFTLFGPTMWKPNTLHLVGFAWPHLVYGESPYFKNLSLKQRITSTLKIVTKRTLLKANSDYIVTESADVGRRLASKLGFENHRIFTVHNSVHQIFSQKNKWIYLDYSQSNRYMILMVSAYYPHKNFQLIPRILEELNRSDVDIVTTIPQSKYDQLNTTGDKRWRNLGPVAIEELPGLYEQAESVLHTSLLECFSVSYLEAMYMKKAIVVPDLPFARYVCGDAGLYYRANDPISAATQIIYSIEKCDKQRLEIGKRRVDEYGLGQRRFREYTQIIKELCKD